MHLHQGDNKRSERLQIWQSKAMEGRLPSVHTLPYNKIRSICAVVLVSWQLFVSEYYSDSVSL